MHKSAKLWVLFTLIFLLVNSSLLILYFGLSAGESLGRVPMGDLDYPTYLAKMKLGYEGGWQYINRYTTEPHEPTYVFLFYILLGHLARVLDLNLPLTFHLARFFLAILALRTLCLFLAKYAGEKDLGKLFFLSVFISGTFILSIDISPQYHIYAGMAGFTHYMLTLACLLFFFDTILDYEQNSIYRSMAKGAAALNILAMVHPFMVVLAGLVSTFTVLINRRIRQVFPLLLACALSVTPAMLYFLYIFQTNQVLAGWRQQAVPGLGLLKYLFHYGPGSLFAYLIIILSLAKKIWLPPRGRIFAVWFVTALALFFTPLISSRFQWFFFASVPIAFLSLEFMRYLDTRLNFRLRIGGTSIITWLLIFLLVLPSFNVIRVIDSHAYKMITYKEDYPETFIHPEDMVCYRWLEEKAGPQDIILADEKRGNLVPFLTNSQVYLGHSHETLDYQRKKSLLNAFLSKEYKEFEARDFLNFYRVKYLVISHQDEARDYDFLEPIIKGKTITVFRYKDGK